MDSMRLVYEFLPNTLFNGSNSWEYNMTWNFGSWAFDNLYFIVLYLDSLNLETSAIDFFNCYKSQLNNYSLMYYLNFLNLNYILTASSMQSFSNFMFYTQELAVSEIAWNNVATWNGISFFWNYSVSYLFLSLYLFYIIFKILIELGSITGHHNLFWNNFINLYLYSWIYGGEDKVESIEEIICLCILWPWCVFLIFTHLFSFDNHSFIFGFAEWGLPVLYGLILLTEHFWTFGTYILVYLMGTRGRKSFILTFIEDVVAIAIMIARVVLQSIRGVIVGMFHFICREALLNMTKWWNNEFWFNHGMGAELDSLAGVKDIIGVIADFSLAAGSLVIVMAIMFLQLIFLIVSVWLFCKCWFISWPADNASIDIKNKFFLNLKKNNDNLTA